MHHSRRKTNKMCIMLTAKYSCYFQAELEDDIFRIYDVDNNGTIEFKVVIFSNEWNFPDTQIAGVPGDSLCHE